MWVEPCDHCLWQGSPPSHRSRSSSSSSWMVARLSSPKLSLEGPELCTGLPSGVRAVGSGTRAGGWNLRLYRLVMSICRAGWAQRERLTSARPLRPLLPAPSGSGPGLAPTCGGGVPRPAPHLSAAPAPRSAPRTPAHGPPAPACPASASGPPEHGGRKESGQWSSPL